MYFLIYSFHLLSLFSFAFSNYLYCNTFLLNLIQFFQQIFNDFLLLLLEFLRFFLFIYLFFFYNLKHADTITNKQMMIMTKTHSQNAANRKLKLMPENFYSFFSVFVFFFLLFVCFVFFGKMLNEFANLLFTFRLLLI